MRILTKCCFKISLKAGCVILLVIYWWISVTYIALLIRYFSEHTVPISILIGVIFVTWTVISTVGLFGIVNKRNAYYLIPQILNDLVDCVLRLINLISQMFAKQLVIPRYTIFGSNWSGVPEAERDDGSFRQMLYNLFDEKYPLPNLFALIDLIVRIYFVLVFVSHILEYRSKKLKKAGKRKSSKKGNGKSTQNPSSPRPGAS